jgi:hypothetical protein
MKKKIQIFFFLFIIISVCVLVTQNPKKQTRIKKFISSLSLDERFVLEYFFRCLIQEDSIGYVLLGGKPMSFHSYLKPKAIVNAYPFEPIKQLDLFFIGIDSQDALFHKGLEIWKKHEHHFCGNNIFFDTFEEDQELHFMKVCVINKRLISSKFEKYFHRFEKIDSSIKDVDSLFEALLHNQKFKEKFYSRHDLMGICLGYGEKNADLFQKMSTLLTLMGKLGFTLRRVPSDTLKVLETEWTLLENSFAKGMKDHTSKKFLFNLGLGFRVDPSDPETFILQKKYTKLHKKLTRAYESADFLKKTLELIVLADNQKTY